MGQTALHIAAELGKVDVVEMILKADLDLELKDRVIKALFSFSLSVSVSLTHTHITLNSTATP